MKQIEARTDREERLSALLASLTDQLRRGQTPDMDAVALAHADLAEELRDLWPAVLLAEEWARPAPESAPTVDLPNRHELPAEPRERGATLSLPRSFGEYELLEELGRGGMGVVFKARQPRLGRLVAVKMILHSDLASDEELARFRAEAEAAARLEHPHIVPVHEVGECEGRAYFSMKYVEGTTLARRLASGPLPPREAAQLLTLVAQAIQHAHQNGILHRDLKPSNIMLETVSGGGASGEDKVSAHHSRLTTHSSLTSHYSPKLMDFGLAKRVDGSARLTRTGAILGTPSYMAPEQAAGSRGAVTAASDIYSLGAILYEMLTGRPPFQAASPVDVLMLVLEQDPVPPRLLNPHVDPDLEMICLKCLQKPPELRYRSAADLARDLDAYLQGEPLTLRSSDLSYMLTRMLRETHHAAVLENWGLLWMWHSAKVFLMCLLTTVMAWAGLTFQIAFLQSHLPYLLLWTFGLILWGGIFWWLRHRDGPVSFVERQIAHVWASAVIASISMYFLEVLLGLPALTLSPVLAVIGGMVFVVKAGTLSGQFYFCGALLFLTAVPMAVLGANGLTYLEPLVFGAMLGVCFFLPGLKYYRQRLRTRRLARENKL